MAPVGALHSLFYFILKIIPQKTLIYLFFGRVARLAGSQFPDQGLNQGHGGESPKS